MLSPTALRRALAQRAILLRHSRERQRSKRLRTRSFAEAGRIGGRIRAARLSPEMRSLQASHAARARWDAVRVRAQAIAKSSLLRDDRPVTGTKPSHYQ